MFGQRNFGFSSRMGNRAENMVAVGRNSPVATKLWEPLYGPFLGRRQRAVRGRQAYRALLPKA